MPEINASPPSRFGLLFSLSDHTQPLTECLLHQLLRELPSLLPNSHWGHLTASPKPKWRLGPDHLGADLSLSADFDFEASIHALLDLLPGHLAFHLDILWLLPSVPTTQNTSVEVYGALKRAVDWHGAKVTLVTLKETESVANNDFLVDLGAEAVTVDQLGQSLTKNLLWRGCLSFLEEEDFQLKSLHGFELVASDDHVVGTELVGMISSKRFSRHLKVLTTTKLSKISKRVLSDGLFSLRTRNSGSTDKVSEQLLGDENLFSNDNCLVVKLQFCDIDSSQPTLMGSSAGCKRTTQEWRKAVSNGTLERCIDDNMEKPTEALFFLLYSDGSEESATGVNSKVAVLLNRGLSTLVDPEKSSEFVLGMERQPQVQDKITRLTGTSGFAEIKDEETDESVWDEKRLLAFLDHHAKLNKNRTTVSDTMTPSGDFVVLEAKELLKHFTLDGLPRNSSNLEVLRPKLTPALSEVEDIYKMCWPNVLFLDHPGLHYNRCDQSEEADREAMRLQRTCVGTRETASTCSTQNTKQIVVTKHVKSEVKAEPKKRTPRKSPRKKTVPSLPYPELPKRMASLQRYSSTSSTATSMTSNNRDAIFKQKLRSAVYDALNEKGIGENHKLFRNSFRKLFEICKMYAKDMPAKIGSTKLWLNTVAKQNAETVVNLEIALHGH